MNPTQGTVFSGLRSTKYPRVNCYGVIITARCDLANKKVEKVFFLTALPYEHWLLSRVGAKTILKTVLNTTEGELDSAFKKYDLQWNILKGFNYEECKKVIEEKEFGIFPKEQKKLIQKLEKYYQMEQCLKEGNIKELLNDNFSQIKGPFQNIISGKDNRFTFLPKLAFEKGDTVRDLIVDHHELEYISLEDIIDISAYEIDIKNENLCPERKDLLNKKFFIDEDPGYSMVEGTVQSPWIEYLLQRFANTFTRVGVDVPVTNEEVDKMLKKCLGDDNQ